MFQFLRGVNGNTVVDHGAVPLCRILSGRIPRANGGLPSLRLSLPPGLSVNASLSYLGVAGRASQFATVLPSNRQAGSFYSRAKLLEPHGTS